VKPLSELDAHSTGSDRRLAELFEAAKPYQSNPLTKRRVLIRMQARLHRPPRTLLKPALLGVLFIAGSAAAAALGQRALLDDLPSEQPPLTVSARTLAENREQHATPSYHNGPAPAGETSSGNQPPNDGAADTATLPSPPKQARVSKPRPGPKLARQGSANAKSDDPTRVVEALRALRKQGDPARAQALLRDYMKANPHGALSEEALVLTVEAAHARKDPRAKHHARRYLAQYPRGRHRALAQRVLKDYKD
jgi:hypothetical protein